MRRRVHFLANHWLGSPHPGRVCSWLTLPCSDICQRGPKNRYPHWKAEETLKKLTGAGSKPSPCSWEVDFPRRRIWTVHLCVRHGPLFVTYGSSFFPQVWGTTLPGLLWSSHPDREKKREVSRTDYSPCCCRTWQSYKSVITPSLLS